MARPEFQRLEPAESHQLDNPKPGWRGLPLARVQVARCDGGWVYAAAVSVDCAGFAEPLGIWSDMPGLRVHPTAGAAITAARARIGRWLADRQTGPEAAMVVAWLATVDQPDLFSAI